MIPKAKLEAEIGRASARRFLPSFSFQRDALVCLSLANLLALRLWAGVLDPATCYFLHQARPWTAYLATLLLVVLLSAVGMAFAAVARRISSTLRMLEVAFALAISLALWGARIQVRDLLGLTPGAAAEVVFAFIASAPVVAMLLPARRRVRARKMMATLLLVFSPFAGVTAFQALDAARGSGSHSLTVRKARARSASDHGTRVVVVLFDELDQFRAFEDRTPGLELRAFDALRSEGYHATRVRYPANKTELAIPSLLSGRRVVMSKDSGPSDRRLFFEGGDSVLFSDLPTFLSDASRAGRNSALVGWYHPYCRIMGDELADCFSRANRQEMLGMTLREALLRQSGAFLDGLPQGRKVVRLMGLSDTRMVSISPEWHVESWRVLHAESLRVAGDPDLDVIFLHYPVPHVPGIWDPVTDSLSPSGGTYDGNLELADKCLAGLIEEMRKTGVWERTALVVLADHPKRGKKYLPLPSPRLAKAEVRPIPFLVRPVGGIQATEDSHRFSSLALYDLVPRLLDGRVETADDLRSFFLTASTAPSPGEADQP